MVRLLAAVALSRSHYSLPWQSKVLYRLKALKQLKTINHIFLILPVSGNPPSWKLHHLQLWLQPGVPGPACLSPAGSQKGDLRSQYSLSGCSWYRFALLGPAETNTLVLAPSSACTAPASSLQWLGRCCVTKCGSPMAADRERDPPPATVNDFERSSISHARSSGINTYFSVSFLTLACAVQPVPAQPSPQCSGAGGAPEQHLPWDWRIGEVRCQEELGKCYYLV